VQGIIARITVILPLIVGLIVAIAMDVVDDLMGIVNAVKDGKITLEEQEAIDTRRSIRRWSALRALAGKAPYFTIE
jgi:hypothetical protein|tara:strand:+ start:1328 stop:1555 length:228 start_codon:yes stop_codon:yes gene_type:complete